MFDRFIRLAKARQALAEGRCELALQLAEDPWIREDRRAAEVRTAARAALQQRIDARIAAGDLAGAQRALVRAVRTHPDPVLESRLIAVRSQVASAEAAAAKLQAELRAVEAAVARGELAQAEAALATCAADAGTVGADSVAAVVRKLAERRAAAARALTQALASLAAHDPRAALASLTQAQILDVEHVGTPRAESVLAAGAAWVQAQVGAVLASDGARAAVALVREQIQAVPQLAQHPLVQATGPAVASWIRTQLQAAARPEHELELLHAGVAAASLPGGCAALGQACTALLQLVALRASGSTDALRQALAQAGAIDSPALAAEAAAVAAALAAADERVRAAREQALAGDLEVARQAVVAVLQDMPQHAGARAERDAIERSMREREALLQNARNAATAGRLREALALALAHVGTGTLGAEARQLAMDLSARCERVQHGVDQVRAMLHGPSAASVAGLQQCIAHLDELALLQSDHEELLQLRASLRCEIQALEQCLAALEALPQQPAMAANTLVALLAERANFCSPDRLDAKLLALVDALATCAETMVQSGRLAAVAPLLTALQAALYLRSDLGPWIERLAQRVRDQQAQALALVTSARTAIRGRDLAVAAEHAERAAALAVDQAEVQAIGQELRQVTAQASSLDQIAALTEDGHLADAQEHLDGLAPAQPLLRTRIFDMKQSLAKAQGFDAGFLLRVDEGGEHLVLRSESIVIGNVRDGSADLPVLAAIAGRHARIQRSMSFHGGMKDTLVPEAGDVKVGGQTVASHPLRSGDRVQLGPLALRYAMPSSRSLSAGLLLSSGFQAAGTDRVLLLKDRGRDGRILIGKGSDVHVSVPHASAEVEVYAHKSGQIRVRCEQGGTIDGKPFADEHPVDPGALVQAGGVTLVLLPWSARR